MRDWSIFTSSIVGKLNQRHTDNPIQPKKFSKGESFPWIITKKKKGYKMKKSAKIFGLPNE